MFEAHLDNYFTSGMHGLFKMWKSIVITSEAYKRKIYPKEVNEI